MNLKSNQSLHQKKSKTIYPGEIVIGLNPIYSALGQRQILSLFIREGRSVNPLLEEIKNKALSQGVSVKIVKASFLEELAPGANTQGILAFFKGKSSLDLKDLIEKTAPLKQTFILALDHIEDPRNLGALLRSASAFGLDGVITPKDRAARLTPAALSVAQGGAENLNIYSAVNMVRALTELKKIGFWTVGAEAGQGASIYDFDFPDKTVLILGSEGKGLSRMAEKEVDFLVNIPLANGPVNSLNVSTAGAIFMSFYRKNYPLS